MNRLRGLVAALLLLIAASARAQPLPQPDWPCKQVRVPQIALGGVWTGPSIDEERKTWRDDAAIADLVARITPRRTSLEEAEARIAEFDKSAGDQRKARLTKLFAGVFERMNGERSDVVNGIDRFGRRLKELAEQTRQESQALRDLQDKRPPDPDAIRKASEALQWRLRFFEEQRQMAAFVCESPALIEQRFGALARAIIAAME